MTHHPQVLLPELGFTVDEGLEELIEACWRRGIATTSCCIGGRPDIDDGHGHIDFADPQDYFAERWETLTGYPVTWLDGTTGPFPNVLFDRAEIPTFVAALGIR
jgi:hypothetical protein